MSDKSQRMLEQWSRTREKGVWRYMAFALLTCGLPFAACVSLLDVWSDSREFSIGLFVLRAAIFGCVYGVLTWHWNERKFREYQRENA